MDADFRSGVSSLSQIAVVVPAWQPDPQLLMLIDELTALAPMVIVVVDDGSDAAHRGIFDALQTRHPIHLLRHAINRGKGSALKTAWRFVLKDLPQIQAVVTADADGQHLPHDIVRVAERLAKADNQVVLGCRTVTPAMPFRSRLGNTVTRLLFRLFSGIHIRDTQTGLRGFPRALLPELMELEGERYEFEMAVLAHVCRVGAPIELPVSTVYETGNRSSHFHPLWDSMRVYSVLVRFYLFSLKRRSR